MSNEIKAVAYARVSTLLGQDVENQLVGLRQLAHQRGFDLLAEYIDEGISGNKEKRPGLDRLIKDARRGLFSIVLIHSIDRLGRSTKHLLNLMEEFRHYRVSLISVRESLDFSTPTGQMALTMLSAVSQLEAELISERIKTALAVKKAIAAKTGNGWTCGRKPLSKEVEEDVIRLKSKGYSIRQISKELGTVSKSSVVRILKQVSQNGSSE
ncbi:MAG: recombinase family protein [Bacteriovorax sp.]|jgi:DNA invertase Pin-like site-specific DNA recombinase